MGCISPILFLNFPISCLTVTAVVFSDNEEDRGVVGYLPFPQCVHTLFSAAVPLLNCKLAGCSVKRK